jgi:hypothetical protein
MLMRGCEDDEMGEMSAVHHYPAGVTPVSYTTSAIGESHDPCPFSKYPLKNRYFLSYTIRLQSH